MWIDTNGCPESFHEIMDGKVIHPDGSECEVTEYDLERDKN